jgi:ribosomal protein S18 acetylase RimI-like enzyme
MFSDPRACRADELTALVRLANRVFRASGGDMAMDYPLVFNPGNLENLRVIDKKGEIVSHVGISIRDAVLMGIPLRTASIGAVCTDPGCRGHGLATRLMEDARAHAIGRGADLMLISGGRGLYHRLGYVEVGRFPRYRIAKAARSAAVQVAAYDPADLPALAALYEREPVRFRRSPEDWERMLAAGVLMNRRARLWVARVAGEVAAYLGVQEPAAAPDRPPGAARAMEYAGDRWAIAEAAGAILEVTGAPALELVGPDGDRALAAQAAARRWEQGISSFSGTLSVLDPPTFLARLRPWMEERVGNATADRLTVQAEGGGVRLGLEEETLALDTPGRVTALIFGGETEEARDLPPLAGRLGETLRVLFPLPLFWYGYNYV